MSVFTVIVPAYNSQSTLRKCIESILNQTYPDWELILIDDGSTDGSWTICQAYAAKDSRIRIFRQENAGQGAARNKGIELAAGNYIVFCDADDFYEKDALEVFAHAAEQNSPDLIVGGYTDFCSTADGGILIRAENPAYDADCITKDEAHAEFMHLRRNELIDAPWAKAYRRQLLLEHAIRFPHMKRQQDIYFNLEFYDIIRTLRVIESVIYHYRLPDNDDQLKKYPRNMTDIIKLNYLKTLEVLESWQQLDVESLRYLNQVYVKNTSVLLRLNYLNQWKLNRKDRRELSRKILNDDTTIAACRTVPDGTMDKIIRWTVKSRSVALANLFSAGTVLYQRIRGGYFYERKPDRTCIKRDSQQSECH